MNIFNIFYINKGLKPSWSESLKMMAGKIISNEFEIIFYLIKINKNFNF